MWYILLAFCDVKKHTIQCVGWSHACQHGFWLVTFTKSTWWCHYFLFFPPQWKWCHHALLLSLMFQPNGSVIISEKNVKMCKNIFYFHKTLGDSSCAQASFLFACAKILCMKPVGDQITDMSWSAEINFFFGFNFVVTPSKVIFLVSCTWGCLHSWFPFGQARSFVVNIAVS